MITTKQLLVVAAVVCLGLMMSLPASAQVNGAIFTTTSSGTRVNGNFYALKTDVYLNGGPRNTNDPGLVPDGNYYFQVTDPSGKTLLSADDISCRTVVVQNGRIIGVPSASESPFGTPPGTQSAPCDHPVGIVSPSPLPLNNQEPVQLCPSASRTSDNLGAGLLYDPTNWCDTTPNPGGEYKAWLTPVNDYVTPTGSCPTGNNVFGFCDSQSKTDNFKVQIAPPPPCPNCESAGTATLVACKYWDKDDDGMNEGSDVLLAGWTINASTDSGNLNINDSGPAVSAVTDSTGCATFKIVGFPDRVTSANVTLSETQQTHWNQVAPLQGTYPGGSGGSITVTGCNYAYPPGILPCTSTISVPVVGDDSTTAAPDFGNTGLDLTITKTAAAGFTRTYAWNIAKCAKDPGSTSCVANPAKVDQIGGSVIFNYSVTANETGFTDSAWTVSGTITVSNPNAFDVTGVNVTDSTSDGTLCAINDATAGQNETIPASGTLPLTYTCSYTSPDYTLSRTNTATVSWSAETFNTPDASASSPAVPFTFNDGSTGNPTRVNATITVADCFNGTLSIGGCTGSSATLGTLTATDTLPYASQTFTYSHTVSVPASGCVSYPNTASITQTGQTASATVQVCGPEKTGALTMGYWQNKNGQGIITGQAKTGVCPSGTWLRQYAPFQDLSATATCSQVATYVYNIVKVANSKLTGNAMLRGQMLATSLDVYFSDPALGGNKIGAPAPIGGDSVDLTKICKMIDSSGGTGSCSGTYENVSTAFGGVSSLTVSQMIAYASSQSNVGGSTWYGNVKSTILLAKDAFDAINNQVAFAP